MHVLIWKTAPAGPILNPPLRKWGQALRSGQSRGIRSRSTNSCERVICAIQFTELGRSLWTCYVPRSVQATRPTISRFSQHVSGWLWVSKRFATRVCRLPRRPPGRIPWWMGISLGSAVWILRPVKLRSRLFRRGINSITINFHWSQILSTSKILKIVLRLTINTIQPIVEVCYLSGCNTFVVRKPLYYGLGNDRAEFTNWQIVW